jgi:hypothetical protein
LKNKRDESFNSRLASLTPRASLKCTWRHGSLLGWMNENRPQYQYLGRWLVEAAGTDNKTELEYNAQLSVVLASTN